MKKIVAAVTVLPVILVGGVFFTVGQLRKAELPKNIDIVENGQSEYRIVRRDGSEFDVTAACSNLSRAIKKQTGVEIKVVTDKTDRYDSGAEIPCEIIVGDTNREIGCNHGKSLRRDDFSICMHGRDLVISAGSNDGYAKAVNHVTKELLSEDGLSLAENFVFIGEGEYAVDSLTLCGKDVSEYTIVYENGTAKKYADLFAGTISEKTGYLLDVSEKATDTAIVFGSGSNTDAAAFSISGKDGKISVSAASGMALEAACNELSKTLFEKEEKTLSINNINIEDKLSAPSEYTAFISKRGDLSNTYNKLTNDKKLTVAYFGGSVTVGHAASDRSKYSWRALTTAWLADNFADAEVVEINSAIGASGSHLGAFRVQKDIIAHKPDLLFIEFSINDSYNGESAESAAENYESIIRQVRRELPECDIVTIYITDSGRASAGGDFGIKTAYEKVATAYDIPAVDVGKALITKKFLRGTQSSDWKKYFTDIVHMNDAGFAEYAKVIEEYLANELVFEEKGETKAHALPEKMNANADRELQFILATEDMLENSKGFSFVEKGFMAETPYAKYDGYLKTTAAENSLTFTFTGTELSLFMSSYTSGTVTYEVDGKKWRVDRNSMNNPFPIVKNLEYGEHTITMQFGFKDSTTANIGAFLVR
ncbi:MAG: hypothetical protein IKV98_04005 [Clostridia bacterium]|nr:hypothetical protein [Clostridia bacterium]